MPPNPRRRASDQNGESRIIDAKLPLTWLLGTAGTLVVALLSLVWNVSMQSSKLDQLILSSAKLEKRVDEKDARIDALRDGQFAAQRISDSHAAQIEELRRLVLSVKSK